MLIRISYDRSCSKRSSVGVSLRLVIGGPTRRRRSARAARRHRTATSPKSQRTPRRERAAPRAEARRALGALHRRRRLRAPTEGLTARTAYDHEIGAAPNLGATRRRGALVDNLRARVRRRHRGNERLTRRAGTKLLGLGHW